MAKLDVLTCSLGTFIASNASRAVALAGVINADDVYFENYSGQKHFQKGDNLNILSLAVSVPGGAVLYCSSFMGNNNPAAAGFGVQLKTYPDAFSPANLYETLVNFGNYQNPVGAFLPGNVNAQFKVGASLAPFFGTVVDCTGMNAAWNSANCQVSCILTVEHTLDMVA
jgi:hypothetical protein